VVEDRIDAVVHHLDPVAREPDRMSDELGGILARWVEAVC